MNQCLIKNRVLVVGASPDRINNNVIMRSFVCEGFNEAFGTGSASECCLEEAVNAIARLKPRLVLLFGSCMPDVCDYGPLRDSCDKFGCILAFWLHDDPYEFDFNFRAAEVADWIFSNDRWAALHYDHPKVRFLPMAASINTHFRDWNELKKNDVFFCGVAFPNRITLMSDLKSELTKRRVSIKGAGWPSSLTFAKNQRLSNSAWSDECSSACVTINMGRTLHLANRRFQLDATTPGPRTFEAAMAGTVQMMFVDGLSIIDFFEPEKEIVLFDDPRDFAEKLDALLVDNSKRKEIAMAAQKRAVLEHTYTVRVRKMINWINEDLVMDGKIF